MNHQEYFNEYKAKNDKQHEDETKRGCTCPYPKSYARYENTDFFEVWVVEQVHAFCPIHGWATI